MVYAITTAREMSWTMLVGLCQKLSYEQRLSLNFHLFFFFFLFNCTVSACMSALFVCLSAHHIIHWCITLFFRNDVIT